MFLEKFNSLTDLYSIICQVHPTTNSSISLLQADYWYDLLSTYYKLDKSRLERVEEVVNDFSNKESISSTKNVFENKNENIENPHPNALIKSKESIKIIFNTELIHLKNSGLDGLYYIYHLIDRTDPAHRISAATLRYMVNGKAAYLDQTFMIR